MRPGRRERTGRVSRRSAASIAGTDELDLAHVRHVEEPGGGTDRRVLLEDRGVLDRHLESAELDHPRGETQVRVVEGCPFQGGHAPVRAS